MNEDSHIYSVLETEDERNYLTEHLQDVAKPSNNGPATEQQSVSHSASVVEDCCGPERDTTLDSDTSDVVNESYDIRALTADEEELLRQQNKRMISDFKKVKLQDEARKNWDLFYKRNGTKFFKDRHWIFKEFDDVLCQLEARGKWRLLEAGCGVGNFLFPLLEQTENCFAYACDFSPRAVEMVQLNRLYDKKRCAAFECDLSNNCLTESVTGLDAATLIFVLSAVPPAKMATVLSNIHQALRPGGLLLFRDYGMYDHAMLRFSAGKKLQENSYVRQDGTLAYYFQLEEVRELCLAAGFQVTNLKYLLSETVNKKKELCVPRVFVQATLLKEALSHQNSSTVHCGVVVTDNTCEHTGHQFNSHC